MNIQVYVTLLVFLCTSYCEGFNETLNLLDEDKPLQVVRPDPLHKQLKLVKENLKILKNINGPVATVAVVGKYHSGKSFLMNQLMGKANGFGIGSSVQPETMGIWMWGKPVLMDLDTGQQVSVIFLDTEGFAANNISENYDAKIFAVATLISSHLIYNSVKIVDQSDIDYLELLARRTQLFALRSQMSRVKWTDDFIHDLLSFPPLIWVVQDFVQTTAEKETSKEWLHRLMDTHSRENENYEISLLDIFKSVDCHTLFIPAVKKRFLTDLSQAREEDLTEEYIEERNSLLKKLKKELVPKEKNHKPISGTELAALLEVLVSAANDGSLAEIPSRWTTFVERIKQTATEDCHKFYVTEMMVLSEKYSSGPVSMHELEEWHNHVFRNSLKLLEQLLKGLEETAEEAKQKLTENIQQFYDRTKDINEKKIRLRCSELQNKMELIAEDSLRALTLPVPSSTLHHQIAEIIQDAQEGFRKELGDLVVPEVREKYLAFLRKTIHNLGESFHLRNSKALESMFLDGINLAVDKFKILTKDTENQPLKPSFLKTLLEKGFTTAVKIFESQCSQYSEESLYEPHKALLENRLMEQWKEVEKKNEDLVQSLIKTVVKELLHQFRDNTDSNHIPLPLNETDLNSRLQMEMLRVERQYKEQTEDFSSYKGYTIGIAELQRGLHSICGQRRNENVEAFTEVVKQPLETSKQIIVLSADKYTTAFSVKQYMRSVCLLNLNEGKPKHWSQDLKYSIVDYFLTSDEELQNIIRSKQGWYSSIIGFFQWLLWLFNLS
ncbi:uncharacterized protein LOC143228907 isoform X2 [Tachypleus tridentatus]|uniref:uncharacterized protein LOC143228907 isoform X2 n=1 Tax=Tachypleus tridentatus TaxID=6853 RepID=UPI003FD04662